MVDNMAKCRAEISQRARALAKEKRKVLLMSFSETELHQYLKHLFQEMDKNAWVEITHSSLEYGKDLVVVRDDQFGRRVIGVVVKRGDIKGQTKGKVDEIKSQVEQAFSHPAVLKGVQNPLKINEVWVMLAGELSNSANTRLEKEFPRQNLQIFDINWLVDNFTIYYPQVFFEGKVIDYIQEKILALETKHMFGDRGKNLSECFVDPLISSEPVFDEGEELAALLNRKKMPLSKLELLLSSHSRTILAGDPGTGKSVALAKLAIGILHKAAQLVTRGSKRKVDIPLLLPVRKFLEYDTVDNVISAEIPTEIRDRFTVAVLMLDGLDEVVPDLRDSVIIKAREFADHLGCPLIVTSRKIDVIKNPPAGFKRFDLLPFELGQAIKLMCNVLNDERLIDTLRDGLEKIKQRITLTPLSLMLLIRLVEDFKEIPASITELYDRFSDIALGREDKEKGIEVLFEYLIKKRFLSKLAFLEFISKNRLEITRAEFDDYVAEYAKEYGWDSSDLRKFISEIERAGILEVGQNVFFKHRSFLEFFAAFYIYDTREDIEDLNNFVYQLYYTHFCEDVVFFYVGLKRDISKKLLEKILSHPSTDIDSLIRKFSAGVLLQAAWHTPTAIKSFGIENTVYLAPELRDQFLKLPWPDGEMPKFLADVLVLVIGEISLGSTFLLDEINHLMDRLVAEPTAMNLYLMLVLLQAVRRFLTPAELRLRIDQCLDMLATSGGIDTELQVRTLLILDVLETSDISVKKSLRRKLSRLQKKHPWIFKRLLPSRKKALARGS